jgi:hypothetical protein
MFKITLNERTHLTIQPLKITSARQINSPRTVNQTEHQIPIHNATEKTNALVQTASDMFDPNLSSPPNEFISNLQLRMDVYFARTASSSLKSEVRA